MTEAQIRAIEQTAMDHGCEGDIAEFIHRLALRVQELERELELAQAANTRDMMHFTVKAFAAGERHAGAKVQELEREVAALKEQPCETCGWRRGEYNEHPDRKAT